MRNVIDDDNNKQKWIKLFSHIVKENFNFENACNQMGFQIVNDFKNQITSGSFVPNSEYTIKKKGSSRPLIDTAKMRNSITFILERKK